MPRPDSAARNLFTNRVRAKAEFTAALDAPKPHDPYQILHWWGVGGQGKSALLEEFQRILRERNENAARLGAPRPAYALVNFRERSLRSQNEALRAIRDLVARTAGRRFFPAFDHALLRYAHLTQPGARVEDLRRQLFTTGSEWLDKVLEGGATAAAERAGWASGIPGLGIVTKAVSLATGAGAAHLHKWWRNRGQTLIAEIDAASTEALFTHMPRYLACDLAALAPDVPRLVVLLDTYERLREDRPLREGDGARLADAWVRTLIRNAPGILFVLAGRDRIDTDWHAIEPTQYWPAAFASHPLTGFTRQDAQELLGPPNWNITDPAILARILAGARAQEYPPSATEDDSFDGYLPYCLHLQAETHAAITDSGHTPRPEDFGGTQPQILDRFLEHLAPGQRALLSLAAYPSTLTPEVLAFLADRYGGGAAMVDWCAVTALSLVSPAQPDGSRYLHDLLRRDLQSRDAAGLPDRYRAIHTALRAWFRDRAGPAFTAALTPAQEAALRAAIAHGDRLAGTDPNSPPDRVSAIDRLWLGDVRGLRGDTATALAENRTAGHSLARLAASDPANTAWQRDLSVSHNRIGDMLRDQGDGAGALAAYQQAMAIRARIAAADPANTEWQRDLSVSHERIGDMLRAQGDGAGALAAYRQTMAISARLAAADPANTAWQRGLSISHERIGDMLRSQGDGAGALAAYRARMEIAARLAAADPANTAWQRDLSVSHNRIGDVLRSPGDGAGALAAYRQAMAIGARLAVADPTNTEWQRDLSVSHNRIGDMLSAQGDGAGALAAYLQTMAISARLAAADPANTAWQRDLSISHERIGDMLETQGDIPGALEAYRHSRPIAAALATLDPSNAEWRTDLAITDRRLAELEARLPPSS